MTLSMRRYQNEEDYWSIREFLRRVMIANNLHEYSWHAARWDYWWWFANPNIEHIPLEENVFFWETGMGQIAAVLNPEGHGQAFPQLDPDFSNSELLNDIISVAEDCLSITREDGRKQIWFWTVSNNQLMIEALTRRGFNRVDRPEERETMHRRSMDEALPDPIQVAGYTIRALGSGLELLERCYASGLGFHDDNIHTARQNRDNPSWYHHIQSAPLYRRDLDLVAVAADGSIASFCTIWFDDVTRTAYFEPVATVPAHRKRGLGKALLIEGLYRLKRMGCKVAFVGGYSQAANALYSSVMGPDFDFYEPWEKVF